MIALVERALDAVLPVADERPAALSQAMRWAVMGGGKRLRPQLCMMAAMACGGKAEDALWPACAIELLHSYTLVHDDLPAMDNDAERRGRPSVWAKFGEANAILAGDALQALAFAAAARAPRNAQAIVAALAEAASAVVQGQTEDLGAASDRTADIDFIFARKTAALFAAAARMGALAAGAGEADVARLEAYGRRLGMAFQHEDDLLDVSDGAFSSVAILGRDETLRRIALHTAAARDALNGLPGDVSRLDSLAQRLASRVQRSETFSRSQ